MHAKALELIFTYQYTHVCVDKTTFFLNLAKCGCLGPIYNLCKFGGDISIIKQVRGFAVKLRNDVMTSLRHRNLEF